MCDKTRHVNQEKLLSRRARVRVFFVFYLCYVANLATYLPADNCKVIHRRERLFGGPRCTGCHFSLLPARQTLVFSICTSYSICMLPSRASTLLLVMVVEVVVFVVVTVVVERC